MNCSFVRQAQALLLLTGEAKVGDTNFRLESTTERSSPVRTSSPAMIDQTLLEKLLTLQAEIPDGEGAVYARVFSDLSGSIDLDMWGVTVASASFGEKFSLLLSTVEKNNPAWLPQLEALVEKLNTHMP